MIPDKLYLQAVYYSKFHRFIDFDHPKTFNEKLQWLKLYDRDPEYITLVDKYAVKDYVADRIGEKYVIPTIGAWHEAGKIEFDTLPNSFVLKCNHDSGGIVICKNKEELDRDQAVSFLSAQLSNNGFWYGREWPYKSVRPCIIAENYLEDPDTGELRDYKFFCFNGKVRVFKIDFGRFTEHHANYYDREGKLLTLGEINFPPIPEFDIRIPDKEKLEEMIALTEYLAKDISFLRVDFYLVEDSVFFGEMTFYPASGFGVLTSDAWDRTLGDWLELPDKH